MQPITPDDIRILDTAKPSEQAIVLAEGILLNGNRVIFSFLIAIATTFAPSLAKASTMPFPMPEDAR